MMHQPNHQEKPNITAGIRALRKMQLRALKESHLSAADEMLYPGNLPYIEDVLSYIAIGARSVENQQHRLTVSGLKLPVGMKNPTGGDQTVMLNSIQAAQLSHIFIYNGWEVETDGNPLTHAMLRGAVSLTGVNVPNYHYEDLMHLVTEYEKRNLQNPSIIVDASHGNSNKDFRQQPRVVEEVLHSRKSAKKLRTVVRGIMVESYLVEGNQSSDGNQYGQSITDACLGWEDSEKLIYKTAELV